MLIAIITTSLAVLSGVLLFRFVISPLIAAKIAYKQAFTVAKSYPENVTGERFSGPYRESRKADIELIQEYAFESVETLGFDGVRLRGRVYENPSSPVMICFHGYRGTSVEDFCGVFNYLKGLGFTVLLVDQRHQGHSQGSCMTFGYLERRDVVSWVSFVKARYGADVPVWLYGMSMGAATVLLASEWIETGSVRGIIADSAYTSADRILFSAMKHHGAPIPNVSYRIVSLGACVYGHFRPGAVRVTAAVKNAKAPILLMHGESDTCVPCEMSRDIYNANPDKITLYTFSGAEHILSCYYDPIRYRKILGAFLRETGLKHE